jgi:hydrogenase expression/formation protein HypC
MCLGMPGKVLSVSGKTAVVEIWGVERTVTTKELVSELRPGDYVIEHRGEVVRRIPESEIYETLGLYEILLTEAGEDPIASECAGELAEV